MRQRNAGLWQQFFQFGAAVFNGFDFVVQKVNLPTALEFAQYGLPDHAVAFAAHKRLDGQAALRCGGDHAQVTQAFQGHAKCARNRGGGQGQHVDFSAQGFHLLFVAHPKTVFLVNDQ